MPSDAQRINIIKMLCDRGFSDRIFISHDIHTKHRMVRMTEIPNVTMYNGLFIMCAVILSNMNQA